MLVGLACAILYNAVMFACDVLTVPYGIALVIAFSILAPAGYILHSLFTFERGMVPVRFARYAGGMLTAFPGNFAIMVVLVSVLGVKVPIATLLCTAILFVWNYFMARWAISRHRS